MRLYMLLQQDKVWIDRTDIEHQIADMEPRYCANVVRFLQRQHNQIGDAALLDMAFLPMPREDTAAFDAVDQAIQAEQCDILSDSLKWLNETPLLVGLSKRAGEVA